MPDYSQFKEENLDWGYVYHPCKEEVPHDAPQPKGKCVRTTSFVDANLMHDMVTGRSVTGILHLLNKTPIEWFCKKQNTVESATYGSEFVAARIATEQIMDLRLSLRYLGVPLDGPSWMFGNNLSVIKSATIPSSTLKKRHNALAYHRVREAIVSKIVRFCHIEGKYNPADVLSKYMSSHEWFALMKPLIFWTWRDDEVPKNGEDEGSVTRLSLIIEQTGLPHIPEKCLVEISTSTGGTSCTGGNGNITHSKQKYGKGKVDSKTSRSSKTGNRPCGLKESK